MRLLGVLGITLLLGAIGIQAQYNGYNSLYSVNPYNGNNQVSYPYYQNGWNQAAHNQVPYYRRHQATYNQVPYNGGAYNQVPNYGPGYNPFPNYGGVNQASYANYPGNQISSFGNRVPYYGEQMSFDGFDKDERGAYPARPGMSRIGERLRAKYGANYGR